MDRVGNLVVTWYDSQGVTARRFDRGGAPQGSGFRVTGDAYFGHDVAKSANGNFVVVWANYYADVSAELYGGDGVVLRSDFPLEAPKGFRSSWGPVAAMDRNGGFVAVWTRDDGGVSGGDIIGQRFDSFGNPLGGDFLINTYTAGPQYWPSVAMNANDDFVVAWAGAHKDGSGNGVFGQRFDAAGRRAGDEFQINTSAEGNRRDPTATMGTAGDFFVAWTSNHEDSANHSVFGQYYDRAGRPVGGERKVSTGRHFRSNPHRPRWPPTVRWSCCGTATSSSLPRSAADASAWRATP